MNSKARSFSPRAREVIVKALSADFDLEVGETTGRDHASELAGAAVRAGFDAVLSFGGDGTLNEVAQPLVGTDVTLGVLPGGQTNVMARTIGVPLDPVEATAFTAQRLRARTSRRINVGRLDERYFLFSAGMGLDAEVVKRVEADPEGKRRWAEWSFLAKALRVGMTEYRGRDRGVTVTVGAVGHEVVFVVCGNARPFTYFKRWPVDALPQARLDGGLDLVGLTSVRTGTIPKLAWGVLVSRSLPHWRNSRYLHDVDQAELRSTEPLAVQVDGDYIGDRTEASITSVRDALDLIV